MLVFLSKQKTWVNTSDISFAKFVSNTSMKKMPDQMC